MKSAAIINGIPGAAARSITRRIASNMGWIVLSEALGKCVFLVMNMYLARKLGVENFGVLSVAQTVILYCWLAADLGIHMYGTREIARHKDDAAEIIAPLLTIRLAAGVVVFMLYIFCLLTFFGSLSLLYKLTFAGCGFYLVTYSFYVDWVLRGLEEFRLIVLGSAVSSGTFAAGTLALVKGNNDVVVVAFIWSVSFLFGGGMLFFILTRNIKYKPCFNISTWMLHMKESIRFTLAGGVTSLYAYLPMFLLGVLFSKYDTGIFSASFRIITPLSAVGAFISIALYPIVSELYCQDKTEFKKANKLLSQIMLAIGIPAGALGFTFADRIVGLLLGPQYADTVIIFKILSWILPLQFIKYKYATSFNSTGYQLWQIIPTLAGIVAIAACIFLFPKGLKYFALATVVAELFVVICYVWMSKITYERG